MRSMILGVALAVGLTGSAAAQDARAKGEQIYVAQKCSICHSIAGKGNPKGALDGVGSKLTPDDIRLWIVDAKAMTAKTKAPPRRLGSPRCAITTCPRKKSTHSSRTSRR
jgi:mono/diheme cytochrome c family protein